MSSDFEGLDLQAERAAGNAGEGGDGSAEPLQGAAARAAPPEPNIDAGDREGSDDDDDDDGFGDFEAADAGAAAEATGGDAPRATDAPPSSNTESPSSGGCSLDTFLADLVAAVAEAGAPPLPSPPPPLDPAETLRALARAAPPPRPPAAGMSESRAVVLEALGLREVAAAADQAAADAAAASAAFAASERGRRQREADAAAAREEGARVAADGAGDTYKAASDGAVSPTGALATHRRAAKRRAGCTCGCTMRASRRLLRLLHDCNGPADVVPSHPGKHSCADSAGGCARAREHGDLRAVETSSAALHEAAHIVEDFVAASPRAQQAPPRGGRCASGRGHARRAGGV